MPHCAVLGSPIAHSLSPVLHRAAYAELGLGDWDYRAVEVTEEELPGFLGGLDEHWRGLSLTMPLKRAVLSLLDDSDELVRRSGVANTVVLDADGRHGANTDIPGAVAAIRERTAAPVTSAVVLGGGATATSVLLALNELGCARATLVVREPARAAATVAVAGERPGAAALTVRTFAELGSGVDPADGVDIVVSTVPAAAQTALVVDGLLRLGASTLFEVLYDPWPTPLAAAAADVGATLVGGLDLLVHQAAIQVRLMTGERQVPVAAMRVAGERALAERSRHGA